MGGSCYFGNWFGGVGQQLCTHLRRDGAHAHFCRQSGIIAHLGSISSAGNPFGDWLQPAATCRLLPAACRLCSLLLIRFITACHCWKPPLPHFLFVVSLDSAWRQGQGSLAFGHISISSSSSHAFVTFVILGR